MKTLLIDNGSTLVDKLGSLSPGEETIVSYDNIPLDISCYSLILLCGSSRLPVYGNEKEFSQEIALIRSATVPVIGVCLGHELIAHAFNSSLTHFSEHHVGMTRVQVVNDHSIFNGVTEFTAYENHQFGVKKVSNELEVLAKTDHAIAIVKHREKHIYGFQFHPEHHKDEQFGDEIYLNLFRELTFTKHVM